MKPDEYETIEEEHLLVVIREIISSQKVTLTPLPEEAEWVQQAIQGSREAFVKLLESYGGSVYCYFFHKVRSIAAARTLTSETFHIAQESINGDKWHGPFFGTWLVLIANSVFDKWLREKMHDISLSTSANFEESTGEYTSASDVFPLKDEEDILWRLVKDLSLAQQRLLVFRHIDHLSFAEIAIRLGRSSCHEVQRRKPKKTLYPKQQVLPIF